MAGHSVLSLLILFPNSCHSMTNRFHFKIWPRTLLPDEANGHETNQKLRDDCSPTKSRCYSCVQLLTKLICYRNESSLTLFQARHITTQLFIQDVISLSKHVPHRYRMPTHIFIIRDRPFFKIRKEYLDSFNS